MGGEEVEVEGAGALADEEEVGEIAEDGLGTSNAKREL